MINGRNDIKTTYRSVNVFSDYDTREISRYMLSVSPLCSLCKGKVRSNRVTLHFVMNYRD
jgi:hypothetical protein